MTDSGVLPRLFDAALQQLHHVGPMDVVDDLELGLLCKVPELTRVWDENGPKKALHGLEIHDLPRFEAGNRRIGCCGFGSKSVLPDVTLLRYLQLS